MNSTRIWLIVLIALTFLAGTISGYLFAVQGQVQAGGLHLADYEARLIEEYDLDERQRESLRWALYQYEKELDDLEAHYLRAVMEDDLVKLGNKTLRRIRGHAIPADRLAEFDASLAGIEVLSPAPSAQQAQ